MGLFDKLTVKNFSAFALQNYDDPQCADIEEFQEDLRRFRYLKRLLQHDSKLINTYLYAQSSLLYDQRSTLVQHNTTTQRTNPPAI